MQKIQYIQKNLGKNKVQELISLLQKDKVKEVIQIILLDYYDILYKHTVDSKEYSFEVHSLEELKELFP